MTQADKPIPPCPWHEDEMFKEFGCYGGAPGLGGSMSSGYSLVGGGGRIPDEDDEDDDEDETGGSSAHDHADAEVVLYVQGLDSGDDITMRITPASARQLAEMLIGWADDADGGTTTSEEAIEKVRAAWYANGGLLAGR